MQDDIVTAIGKTRADLLAWLGGVDRDSWAAPTACAPWDFKDVLAHVVEGEVNVGRVYRGEVTDLGPLDPGEGVERWRALPGVAVRAALWQHGIATQRVLDSMTPETWQRTIKAFGCRRMSQLVRLHLFDLAVHSHDLTDALGAPPLWGQLIPFLVEHVVRAAPASLTRRRSPPEGAVSITVPSMSRTWTLAPLEHGWAVSEDANAQGSVVIEGEALVLLTTGRAPNHLSYESSGDADLVERLLAAWRVV